ncbi:histone demethylase Jhd2p [Diutina catenulata]
MFDKSLLTECPALRPSEVEFADPIGYLSRPDIAALGRQYGLVKIIPPPSFKPGFTISPSFRFHTRIQPLSDLGLLTRSREFFRQSCNRFLVMRNRRKIRRSFAVGEPAVAVHYYDLYVAVENHGGAAKMTAAHWSGVAQALAGSASHAGTLAKHYHDHLAEYAHYLSNITSYEFPEDDDVAYDACRVCGSRDQPQHTLLCDNCDGAYHTGCVSPPLDEVPDGQWFCRKCLVGTGEYGFEETSNQYSIDEFRAKCAAVDEDIAQNHFGGRKPSVDAIESLFWDIVDDHEKDITVEYGADIHNMRPGEVSGFPMPDYGGDGSPQWDYYVNHPFNLNRLPHAAGSLLCHVPTKISGMTIPWIYVGSMLSTFCWHVEDHYTLSANYCHLGATKKWYGVPAADADRFEHLMRTSAPDLFKKQPDLLHQLVTLMNPTALARSGVRVCYADQQPGEYVITYPRVYHAGFNCGFNFNEAVNFTMKDWLAQGQSAVVAYRSIRKENVFNHYQLVENVLREYNRRVRVFEWPLRLERDLVDQCLAQFAGFVARQEQMLAAFQAQGRFTVRYRPKLEPGTDDDDLLCECCKTHLGYQYCVIEHIFSHALKVEGGQLPTPNASPQEAVTRKRRALGAALADKSDELAQVSEMDQFVRLVEEAKRKAEDDKENSRPKRKLRKTTTEPELAAGYASPRVQRINQPLSKLTASLTRMGMGKMVKININGRKKTPGTALIIRLCLECASKDLTLGDQGAQLVYECHPSRLNVLIQETRMNLARGNIPH